MAIIINRPYIENIGSSKVRLCSKIEGSINDVLYYEVDKKYAQYLCDDRVDPFVLGLLNGAMYENEDIICNSDITDEILFQLQTYYIPIISKNNPSLHNITIQSERGVPAVCMGHAVATGNSGGVDSLYTILKYSKDNVGVHGVTHLLFNNISTGDVNEKNIRDLFERDALEKKQISDELGLDFVAIYTNLYSFYKQPGLFNKYYTAQYVSAVYTMPKLFGVFYFSSAYPVEEFSLSMSVVNKSHDSACYDLFTLHCLSTRAMRVYSSGMEVTRGEKLSYIVDHPVVHRHMQVCAIEQDRGNVVRLDKLNCGTCRKCQRTVLQLYAINKLSEYQQLFDLRCFYANPGRYIGKGLARDYPAFSRMIKQKLKKNGILPANTWVWEVLYRLRYFLSKSPFLVRLYHGMKSSKKAADAE